VSNWLMCPNFLCYKFAVLVRITVGSNFGLTGSIVGFKNSVGFIKNKLDETW
jgi:hypothetical protein